MHVSRLGAIVVALAVVVGCGGSNGGDRRPTPDGGGSQLDGGKGGTKSLTGRVFDAETGRAVSGAQLRADRGATQKTDAKGRFELVGDVLPSTLEVTREDYAPTRKAVPSGGGYMEAFVKKIDERVKFRGDEGVTVELDTGVRLVIPKDAVRDRDGKAVAGEVTLELTSVDGRARAEASSLPGDGVAAPKKGEEGRIGIEAALDIRILDGDGAELDVDPARDVFAELPQRNTDIAEALDVYSYDTERDRWREEGVAAPIDIDGKRYHRADIEHLSWWSFGKFFSKVSCLRACVESAQGNKIDGAQVWVVGASVPGVSTFFTDASGCGAVDVVAGSEVVVVAQADMLVSASKSISTSATAMHAADDPSECTDAGTFVLGAADDGACPSSFALCGDVCSDLISSEQSCGDCNVMCSAAQTCIASTCTCPAGDPECSAGDAGVGGMATINGKVEDAWGDPVAGYALTVAGQAVTSGADGSYTVNDVTLPYALSYTIGTSTYAYLGVTRTDPKIVTTNPPGPTYSASLTGATTGGIGYPMPANHMTNISVQGAFLATFDARQLSGDGGAWTSPGGASLGWRGTSSRTGTLFGIQHNMSTFAFTGMGSKSITVQDGMDYDSPVTDFNLAPVTTHTVSGSVSGPNGATINAIVFRIGTFSRALMSPGATYALEVPNGVPAEVRMALIVSGTVNGKSNERWYYIDSSDTAVDLALPEATVAISPADAATGVAVTESFSVTKPADTVMFVTFTWTGPSGSQLVRAHVPGSSITVEALEAAGLKLPRGTVMSWTGSSIGAFNSVDDLLAPDFNTFYTYTSYGAARTATLAP